MNRLIAAVLLFLSHNSFCQKFELGKVSLKEVEEKWYSKDSAAPAAILQERAKTYFVFTNGFRLVTEVEARIKIYKKEGYQYANVEVPYIAGLGQENVIFSNVATYNIKDGKVVRTELKQEDFFSDGITTGPNVKKVLLPAVVEGSVIEYRYVKESPFLASFPDWYFQRGIPVNKMEYTVHIPGILVYNRILNDLKMIKETTKKGRVKFEHGIMELYMDEIRQTYTAENVPAYAQEDHVDNIVNYIPYVKHELSKFKTDDGVVEHYASNWHEVAKTLYESPQFGEQLAKQDYFRKDVDSLLQGIVLEKEVVSKLLDFVKNRMTWNGSTGIQCREEIEETYAAKTGNAAAINLMLVAMLQYKGLDASPVVLATRDRGHVNFVSLNEFNYLVAAVNTPSGIILLDATSKYATPGIIPLRAVNNTGRLIKKDLTSRDVSLICAASSLDNTTISASIGADGTTTGKARIHYFDYNALNFRENNILGQRNAYLEKLEQELNGLQIDNYTVADPADHEKPVVEEFDFKSSNSCEAIGDKLYFAPLLFYTMEHNPFSSENRAYPLDFGVPVTNRYTINISIPKGYIIEYLPKSGNFVLDNIITFKYVVSEKDGNIQVLVTHEMKTSRIEKENYKPLQDFYDTVVKAQSEKIVLKKA